MATNKTITMHPLNSDGDMIDPTVNLYPKTLATNVLDTDNVTPYPFQKAITVNDPHNYLQKQGESVLTFNVNAFMKQIIETLYPVGAIYCSYDAISDPNSVLDPGNIFGLTMQWEAIPGRFLLGAGDNGEATYSMDGTRTGGSKNAVVVQHNHTGTALDTTVTVNGSADSGYNLTGKLGATIYGGDDQWNTDGICTKSVPSKSNGGGANTAWQGAWTINANHAHSTQAHSHTLSINNDGESGTDKNMPPYIIVQMWRRKA